MKIFEAFKTSKELVKETEYLKIYKCICDDKQYKIIVTKNSANKHTIIHCIDDYIAWEQTPRLWHLAGKRYADKVPIFKFDTTDNVITLFVVKGKPNGITGLDEGIFRSANRFNDSSLNVIRYCRFKEM